MVQAMLAGVASIRAQQTRMNVIGNNLANVNTTAYKGNRVTFQEMMSQTLRGALRPSDSVGGKNPMQTGLGVLISGTDTNQEQGSLNATNRPTDLAVQGNGFFITSNTDRLGYTRDGAFDLDSGGDLVHRATGERLMGWTADPQTGDIDTNQPIGLDSKIQIPLGLRTAVQVTTDVTWSGNLNSASAVGASTRSIVRVFDSLGTQHDVSLTMTKTADNAWDWTLTGNGTDATATGAGSMTFDPATGKILTGGTGTGTVTPIGPAGAFPVTFDLTRISQLSTETQVQASNQNGFAPGSLSAFTIGPEGIITGLYTNGLTRNLGQIAMAIFPNPGGMERLGGNILRSTDNSGVPVIGSPRSGGRGQVNSGFLEQSNVDIGQEFTDLIITQRGFQANTRVVTTVDEMLQELINMKR